MQLISASHIDRERWDKLVTATPTATMYNQALVLDHLAENWCALVIGDYEGGIALPFSVRMGVKGLYTPNFVRSLNWLGKEPDDWKAVEARLRKEFQRCDFRTDEHLFEGQRDSWRYQVLEKGQEVSLGSQAKRSLKKFEKSGLTIAPVELTEALPLILSELKAKVTALKEMDLERFTSLYKAYPSSSLLILGAFAGTELQAAQLFLFWKEQCLFVKGGAREEALKNGAMYALLQEGISHAVRKELEMSFEGSNVESVRSFYCNFGAIDRTYYEWNWDHSPWWFRLLKKLR